MPKAPTLPARSAARSRCSRRTPSRCCWPARRRRTASRRSPAGRRCRSTARRTSSRSPAPSRPSTSSGTASVPSDHELDLARLDLLAQVLRRAADHQAGDEDGQQDEQQHPVEARADAAEDRPRRSSCSPVGTAPPIPVKDVERGVDRAAGGDGRDGREQRPSRRSPKRSSLPSRLPPASAGELLRRRAVGLGGVDDRDGDDEHQPHRAVRSPSPAGGCRPSGRTSRSARPG